VDIDRDGLMKLTKAQILDDVTVMIDEQDLLRQEQIKAQADSIRRVMGGATDFEEVARLQAIIVDLEKRLEMAHEENRRLKGQPTSAINIGIKLRRPA
jgi:hypothetical protein